MSSYVSSQYYIEHNRLTAIEKQCQAELDGAKARAAANRKELLAALEAQKERAKMASEQKIQNQVTESVAEEQVREKQEAKRAKQMLLEAQEEVQAFEQKFGENRMFEEKLLMLDHALGMFGANPQFFAELTRLLEEEIPAQRIKISEVRMHDQEVLRAEKASAGYGAAQDKSAEFVSLRQNIEEGAHQNKTPWEQFLARLSALVKKQEIFGETTALELLEKAEQIEASQQTLFLLQNRDEVDEMEREASDLCETTQEQLQSVQKMYDAYLGACLLCEEDPVLTETSLYTELEFEYNRMQEKYQNLRRQQYITKAFSDVFMEYGIDFTSMEEDEKGRLHLEYSMDEQAGLHIMRSASGAFEMQFSGHTKSAEASLDERRQAVEKAHSFCKYLPQIAEALKERGILFDQMMVKEPAEESIRMESRQQQARHKEAQKLRRMTI